MSSLIILLVQYYLILLCKWKEKQNIPSKILFQPAEVISFIGYYLILIFLVRLSLMVLFSENIIYNMKTTILAISIICILFSNFKEQLCEKALV